jgi:iron uptake system EfeUOB component EfeO/EfeM
LIDITRPDQSRTPARVASDQTAASENKTTSQQQIATTQQQSALVSQTAAQLVASTEATVNNVRARASASESSKIRDPKEATEVAESVAERIGEDEDEALNAHPTLSSSTAREHFLH